MNDAPEPGFPEDAVEVGRIVGPWGVQGWFRVQPHAAEPKALFSSRRWFLRPAVAGLQAGAIESNRPTRIEAERSAAATQARGGQPMAVGAKLPAAPVLPALLRITHSKSHGDSVIAAAQEVPDRGAAERLKGARVFVARSSFPTAGEGEYYWIDLIGLEVVNREGQALGRVIDLFDTGAHSVLRLRRPDAPAAARGDPAEWLIPFVAAYIDDVNLAERRITADWGLDY